MSDLNIYEITTITYIGDSNFTTEIRTFRVKAKSKEKAEDLWYSEMEEFREGSTFDVFIESVRLIS